MKQDTGTMRKLLPNTDSPASPSGYLDSSRLPPALRVQHTKKQALLVEIINRTKHEMQRETLNYLVLALPCLALVRALSSPTP